MSEAFASHPGAGADAAPPASVTDRRLAWWLVVGGLIGLVGSGSLLIEKILVLQDPTHVPSCTLDLIVSCGSVMASEQAALFGFPNPILGVAAFPVVIATGAAILAGARLARWYWLGLQVGVTLGLVFVAWLASQSIYDIGALCPYCMVVWAATIPTFWFVTLRNASSGVFGAGVARSGVTAGLKVWAGPVLLLVFVGIIALITVEFWDHWQRVAGF